MRRRQDQPAVLRRISSDTLSDFHPIIRHSSCNGRDWEETMITRRTFVQGSSMAAMTAAGASIPLGSAEAQGQAQQVPNSAGSNPPKLKAPPNSADCHLHT